MGRNTKTYIKAGDDSLTHEWLIEMYLEYLKAEGKTPKTLKNYESDLRILVKAPLEVRMQRALKRDNITPEKFLLRESSAPEIDETIFEYIINNINLNQTQERIKDIYDKSIIHR